MGVHYLEFYDMYSYFEKEASITLAGAVEKWLEVKDTGKATMAGWKGLLGEVVTDLITHGYSESRAKEETWKQYCEAITEDSERWIFHISDLEDWFFKEYLI